jgi:hypothetical protein
LDFTTFLPRALHRSFAFFGKADWLAYAHLNPEQATSSKSDHRIFVDVQIPPFDPKKLTYDEYQMGADVIQSVLADRIHLSWLYILSKAIASGPKVFYPNLEQCESMAQIDVEVAAKDFQQPYPTVIYQLPKEFSAAIQKQFNLPWRATAGAIHNDNSGFIMAGMVLDNGDRICWVIPPNSDRIEDYLFRKMPNRSGDAIEDTEMAACHLVERVLLNSSMLLMQYPIKKEPSDPKKWNKNRTKPDERQRLFALADMERLSFEQNIVIRETSSTGTAGDVGSGRSMIAHWRRGHWKMQAHGPQHSLRKRILIRPVFVNSQNFMGDLSQTGVEMRKSH